MSSSLFYITISPRRAIGIHQAIGATIVCLYKSDVVALLRQQGAKVFCLEEESDIDVSAINDTAELITHPLVTKYINGFSDPVLIVFKPRKKILRICQKQGWTLLASDPELCRRLEDKIEFFELAKEYDLPIPSAETMLIGERSFNCLVEDYGQPFVLQKRRGHAGMSTKLISSDEEFKESYPDGTHVKVSEFISGPTLTINCCLEADGRLRKGYLWEQVTSARAGAESWTPFAMGTIGVSPATVDDKVFAGGKEMLEKLGAMMFGLGYKGFFGVDFMLRESGEPVIIEVNPRFTATVGFESAVMDEDGKMALIVDHVEAFGHRCKSSGFSTMSSVDRPGFSQLTVHGTNAQVHVLSYKLESGIYGQGDDGWELRNKTLDLGELAEGEVLLLTKNKGMKVRHGTDYAQMIVRGSALDLDGKVEERLVDFFERVLRNFKVRPKDFWKGRYGRVESGLVDIVARPFSSWSGVTERAVDRLRQSQLLEGEVFELLGEWRESCLVRKFDGTLGWIAKMMPYSHSQENGKSQMINTKCSWKEVELTSDINWQPKLSADRSIEEFFEDWEGHPYLWGGVTKAGVDCSGLTQAYFREVKGMVIPKHSKDQRKLGEVLTMDEVENGDLVFMTAKNTQETPHVGVWWNFGVWSACLKDRAVVWKTLENMETDYSVEEARRI